MDNESSLLTHTNAVGGSSNFYSLFIFENVLTTKLFFVGVVSYLIAGRILNIQLLFVLHLKITLST